MKNNRANVLKLSAITVAVALFVGSLIFGSGMRRAGAATSAQTTEDLSADMTANPPEVKSMTATPLSTPTTDGNALLMVQYSSGTSLPSQFHTTIDDRDVILHDDGTAGDQTAGDGTYSAVVPIDFNALADNQDRVLALNSQPDPFPQPSPTPTPTPTPTSTNTLSATQASGNSGMESFQAGGTEEGPAGTMATAIIADPTPTPTPTPAPSTVTVPSFGGSRSQGSDDTFQTVDFRNVKPGQIVPLFPIGTAFSIDPARSLVVTNVKVVEDPTRTFNPCTKTGTPMGPWTFGYLMTQMANQAATGINPSTFTMNWLNTWMNNQTVNGWTAKQRQQIKTLIIDPWVQASGGPSAPLDLSKAPFRLLAIVNRVDLRSNSVYGGGNAGEGRLVFGALDTRPCQGCSPDPYTGQTATSCNPLQFTVIFEYGIDRRGCAIRDWGRQWANLSKLTLGSSQYNAALQAITDQFTKAGVAPSKPNGSALNQLRANEIAIANAAPDNNWQMREFHIAGPVSGFLQEATVAQTPDLSLNHSTTVANYVNTNTPSILNNTYVVPLTFGGLPFRGNAADEPFGIFWDGPAGMPSPSIPNRQARHLFSLNTCMACHTGETATVFTHIKPAAFGTPAGLSAFMTGEQVNDPADGTPKRTFNEFLRRRIDLDKLINSPCFFEIRFKPLNSVD